MFCCICLIEEAFIIENIITSKDNPVIKLYQKLSSSKKERGIHGLFVLEGLRIVEDAIRENGRITHIILTVQAYEKYGENLLQADLRDTRTVVVSNELGNKIAQTESTQGVFAICSIPEKETPVLKRDGRYIVLFGLQDPGNAGMIIRTADALGIDGILMCGSVDLYSPKVIRSTMGSVFRTDIFIENNEDRLFSLFDKSDIVTYASVIDSDAEKITECSLTSGSAVFIGNEGNGLPPAVSHRCHHRITIPMHGTINSLNAAMAAGIMMWELCRN